MAVSNQRLGFFCSFATSSHLQVADFFDDGGHPSISKSNPVVKVSQAEWESLSPEDQKILRRLDPWYVNAAFDVDQTDSEGRFRLYWVLDGGGQSQQINVLELKADEHFPLNYDEALKRLKETPPILFTENDEADMAPVAFAVNDGTIYWCSRYGISNDDAETFINSAKIHGPDEEHPEPYLIDVTPIYFRGNSGIPVINSAIDRFAVSQDEGEPIFYFSIYNKGFREHVLYESRCTKSGEKFVLRTSSGNEIVQSKRNWNDFGFAAGQMKPGEKPTVFWSAWTPVDLLSMEEINKANPPHD